MDYEAAQAELADLVDRVTALVPGDWDITSTGARDCETSGGVQGAQALLLGLGPAVAAGQEQATAAAIEKLLAEEGYETARKEVTPDGGTVDIELRYPVEGADATGFGISVTVSARASTVDAQSRCAPGNADQINSGG